MSNPELLDKQQRLKQVMREADVVAIRSGKVNLAELAKSNSCFAGVDLRKAKRGKGFDLF